MITGIGIPSSQSSMPLPIVRPLQIVLCPQSRQYNSLGELTGLLPPLFSEPTSQREQWFRLVSAKQVSERFLTLLNTSRQTNGQSVEGAKGHGRECNARVHALR